ncbi:MAG: SH3 domain-containing protein [Saprospiraceae bacterium]
MKKTIFILATFFCTFSAANAATPAWLATVFTSQTDPQPYAVGDQLYVHARSGLVLRKTPSKEGQKIANVPYNGQPVRVLALPDPANRYVAERIGEFELSGGWVKVRTSAGQEGYLFDGYLMPFAPRIESSEEGFYEAEWFYPSTFAGGRVELPLSAEEGLIEHFKRVYKDGAEFEQQGFHGGISQFLYLPKGKFSLQQALVLGRILFCTTMDNKGNMVPMKTKNTYDAAQQLITLQNTDGYEQLTIQSKDGRIVLSFSSAD